MTVAADILCPNGMVHNRANGDLTYRGILDSTYHIKNIYAAIEYPYNDFDGTNGCQSKTALFCYGRTTPQGDATYANCPIGTRFDLHTVSAGAVTQFDTFYKKWSGAYGWAKVLMAPDTLSATTVTSAAELATIWGQSSATTGTFRGLSVRTKMTGSGTPDGESLRAYTLVTGAITASGIHGAHITAQLGDESLATAVGSCTGEMAGVRATFGNGANLTVAAGTFASLRLDSYLQSDLPLANCASSYMYICDVGTYGMRGLIRLGTLANRQTSKSTKANGPYTLDSITVSSSAAGCLKIDTPDGSFYIPLYATGALT
jgi:hypothetical protein